MKRVLFVLEGSPGAGQDIVRGRLYQPLFDARGVEVRYLRRRPEPPGNLAVAPRSRAGREFASSLEYKAWWWISDRVGTWANERRIAAQARHCDAVVLLKVRSLELVREIRRQSRARMVYDLADALWLPRHADAYPELAEILRVVDCVTVDNRYTFSFARNLNSNVALWPSPSQVELFDRVRSRYRKPSEVDGRVVLGWVGSPSTVFHLYAAWEALEEVFHQEEHVHLRLVGVGGNPDILPPFERVSYSTRPRYSPEEMIEEVLGMDVGLFPTFDVDEARARGILKVLVYMSGGAAVICSPRGECADVVQDGVNGMLAESRADWVAKLGRLISDADLRRRLAAAGLETVRTRYSLEQSFQHLCDAIGV